MGRECPIKRSENSRGDRRMRVLFRTTQDDARENAQIKLFGLTPLQGRSNKYIPDATVIIEGIEHQIELKTSDMFKKQVSTARNVTLPKLDEYRKVHWIFSQYRKTEEGFEFTGEHYYAHGTQLEPWLERQKEKLLWGTKTYAGLEHWEQVKEVCRDKIDETILEKLNNVLHKRAGLNDPKIGWKTVEKICVKLDTTAPHKHLISLIKDRNKRIQGE